MGVNHFNLEIGDLKTGAGNSPSRWGEGELTGDYRLFYDDDGRRAFPPGGALREQVEQVVGDVPVQDESR